MATRQEERASRVNDSVTGPETLWRWLAAEIGASLLDQEQAVQIVKAARTYHQIATVKHEGLAMHNRETGRAFRPKGSYFEVLDRALALMGK